MTLLTGFARRPGGVRGAVALVGVGALIGVGAATMPAWLAPRAEAQAQLAPASFADLAERLSPAVVNISTAQTLTRPNRPVPNFPEGSPLDELFKDFFDRNGEGGGGDERVQSLGSGFVIDPQGYVVTNNHVIEGADEIEVNFVDGSSLPATLLGSDPKTDIALLKIEPTEPLAAVAFGDSDVARVGDWVLAIGNPFGLGGSVSAGIISARNRDINAGPYDDFIQTDAAINRGNSGGPLFDMSGAVIGVNTAIISPSGGSIGIGFSVPANLAARVVEQLREFGETRRGWLGVRIQQVDDGLAEGLGLQRAEGALIAGVDEAGPAMAGGIRAGDVIVAFDGRPIREMRDLPRIVADTEIGRTVAVEVVRAGARETLQVTVALLEEGEAAAAAEGAGEENSSAPSDATATLGMVLKPLDAAARERLGLAADTTGVLVAEVDPASAAYEEGVRSGDVVVEVSQTLVETPEAAREAIEAARATGRRSVLLMVRRADDVRFVAIDFPR